MASVLSTQSNHSGDPKAGLAGADLTVTTGGAVAVGPDIGDADVAAATGAAVDVSGSAGEQAAIIRAAVKGTMVSKKRMGNEILANANGQHAIGRSPSAS